MFDPHRTRRNDRRFYTKKGQIIQARNFSAPFNIERSKVEAYKKYILDNKLIEIPENVLPVTVDTIVEQTNSLVIQTDDLIYNTQTQSIDISQVSAPRMVFTIKDEPESYTFTVYAVGDRTSQMMPAGVYYQYLSVPESADYYLTLIVDGTDDIITIRGAGFENDTDILYFNKNLIKFRLPPSE